MKIREKSKMDKSKFCRYHKSAGHDTEDCIQLREGDYQKRNHPPKEGLKSSKIKRKTTMKREETHTKNHLWQP
jgi:hypothetical protein